MVHSAAFLRVARCASLRRTTTRNFPSLSRVSLYGPSTSSLPRPRFYTTKRKGTTLQPHVQTQSKPVAKEQSSQSSTPPAAAPTPGAPRHEAQEGTLTMSVPFNPPGGGGGPGPGGSGSTFPTTSSPLRDAILTTSIGLVLMFIGGIVYIKWYKANVLDKIEKAFEAGYDPALELAKNHKDTPWTEDLRRQEQDLIDQIVHGGEVGHYYLLLGPKGSGKGTMIFDAMADIDAEYVSLCDAHPDLEVFRLRLGKALNYEFNEDTQTGLFQRRDPREGGPALDIERALNKLEKVALRMQNRTGRPLVLIINNVHFLHNDEEGRNMLLQLQQKAEAWAASGVLTIVFSSDDFWPFQVLRKTASRMQVVSVYDLNSKEALQAANRMRQSSTRPAVPPGTLEEAVKVVGGRLSYLNKVAKAPDPKITADGLLSVEKAWLLSQIGLIPDCDDDVMDEQKWSSCSWLLLQEFVKIRREQEKERQASIEASLIDAGSAEELPLPTIPYWKCRRIMTRTDFMEELDRINVISIDINHDVRPDSTLVLYAAQEVVEEEDFQEILDGVRDRIDEIESLHRTRELTFKDVDKGDMIRFSVDKGGAELAETLRGKSD